MKTVHHYEPVTQDQAEVYEAERASRYILRLRALRAWPRASLIARLLWWREQRKAEADVRDIAHGLERRAWERAAPVAHLALWSGFDGPAIPHVPSGNY